MRRSMRVSSTSTQIATPSFMVTASGCAPPMPPTPPVRVMVPARRAAELLLGDGAERLVGALQDALGADVDPRPGRHLAVHHQPFGLQLAELLPVGPVPNQVGVRDQHARRPDVGAEHADGLAGLHQHRLVGLETAQRAHESRRTPASCARPAPCRRRRRDRRDVRRPRGRDCSSACAGRLPVANPCRRFRFRARRGRDGDRRRSRGARWCVAMRVMNSFAGWCLCCR